MYKKNKKVVYNIIDSVEFNPAQERRRIKACSTSDPDDPEDRPFPKWLTDRLYKLCDALEQGDFQTVVEIYQKSGYDDKRWNDVVVAEYFPLIVDELMKSIIFGKKVMFGDDEDKVWEIKKDE